MGFRVSVSSRQVSRENSKESPNRTERETTTRKASDIFGGQPAADDPQFYLALVEGAPAGQWVKLGEAPITVGRDRHLDIVLADTDVSRLHLLASVVDGAVIIEDLGSTNGTFIDGRRITRRAVLPIGSLLRIGDHVFRCQRCSPREMERSVQEQRDLERAANYVRSLLPEPVRDGPIHTEWIFRPSARLGGDAFGYNQLNSQTFAIYLFDVCGHGVGAAVHSVSVLNVLREGALPQADLANPVEVLTSLNAMFQMDRHDDRYLTMWYGVYDAVNRTITYGSAGHHPGYLVPPDRSPALPLQTSGLMIGALSDTTFTSAVARVAPDARLYLFSDGIFEVASAGRQWRLEEFAKLLHEPLIAGTSECQRLYGAVKATCASGQFDDDVSLLVVTFP